jgi:hypothetical protein
MYFDNLTLASLAIFVAAVGVFAYACLYRGCITGKGNGGNDSDGS